MKDLIYEAYEQSPSTEGKSENTVCVHTTVNCLSSVIVVIEWTDEEIITDLLKVSWGKIEFKNIPKNYNCYYYVPASNFSDSVLLFVHIIVSANSPPVYFWLE